MTLQFNEAREYMLSQPFVEEFGFADILRFNPYALPKNSTPLDIAQSTLGDLQKKAANQSLGEYPTLKKAVEGLCDQPEGTFDLFIDPVLDEDFKSKEVRSVGAGLTSTSFFRELTELGMHLRNPREFLYLCHELRLKQEIAGRLVKKYNLIVEIPNNCDTGLVVSSRENPDYNDINALLNFCMAYHGVVNTPKFKKITDRLATGINKRLESLADKLVEKKY